MHTTSAELWRNYLFLKNYTSEGTVSLTVLTINSSKLLVTKYVFMLTIILRMYQCCYRMPLMQGTTWHYCMQSSLIWGQYCIISSEFIIIGFLHNTLPPKYQVTDRTMPTHHSRAWQSTWRKSPLSTVQSLYYTKRHRHHHTDYYERVPSKRHIHKITNLWTILAQFVHQSCTRIMKEKTLVALLCVLSDAQ